MHQRAALDTWEHLRVDGLGVLRLAQNESAARAAQGLVGGGGDEVGMRDRAGMNPRRNEAGDVGDVGQEHRANLAGDFTHALEINAARVSGSSDGDHLGPVLAGHVGELVVVDEFAVLADAVVDDLEELARAHPALIAEPRVIGVAGTIVTVAAVEIGLSSFNEDALHGFVLTKEAAEDVFRTLATERLEDRVFNPGLPRERADIIVGGCCVLVGIMRRLRLDSLVVSTRNLLDGAASDMLDQL